MGNIKHIHALVQAGSYDSAIEKLIEVREGNKSSYGQVMGPKADVVQKYALSIAHKTREVFCVVYLNNAHVPLAFKEVFTGSVDRCIVHPLEIYHHAVLLKAACIILMHNHPSGQREPSQEDKEITKRLYDAGKVLGITVLDHIIVPRPDKHIKSWEDLETVSFVREGLL